MAIHLLPNRWILETRNSGYTFGLNDAGLLAHSYWGPRLAYASDYPAPPSPAMWAAFNGPAHLTPEEYPGYGGTKYIEPCLKVMFADGVRDVVLKFVSAEVFEQGDMQLQVHLEDEHYPLRVTLHYRVHEAYDLIERWASIQNTGHEPVILERVWSAQWHLPYGDHYWLSHLTGRWLDEMHLRHEPLVQGVKVLESRRLTTSHHHSPWFAVDDGTAGEDQGAVWYGTLAWSGNWKTAAEVTDFMSTRVNIGINDFDFAWTLNAGETFVTPASFGGYTSAGFGAASRALHDFIRDRILPNGHRPRKVLYNSWEATYFDVDEPSQIQLAQIAAQMGVELFVMDDGWFHKRNLDNAGLGDWWPDAAKFPHGLKPLIEAVNRLGMDFGLWIEPEMVNPDSELYRLHPDWVIHFPTRARTEARGQLILNLARREVQDYLIGQLDRLLAENPISFIKWDMNRNVSEPGWADAPGDQRELWVRYVYGLYHVWETLRQRHPKVIWQSCSGGGGRADLGILRLADQIWVSDNTYSTSRLSIQEGFSYLFPANTMEAWVTDADPKIGSPESLRFRFHVSMCGALGIGGHLIHWSAAERAEAASLIAQYKTIRHIIQFGDLYRLRSAQQQAVSALQYVSKDRSESVIFCFRTMLPQPAQLPRLYLRGLEPAACYQDAASGETRSGSAWMHVGIELTLGNFDSQIIHLYRAES